MKSGVVRMLQSVEDSVQFPEPQICEHWGTLTSFESVSYRSLWTTKVEKQSMRMALSCCLLCALSRRDFSVP